MKFKICTCFFIPAAMFKILLCPHSLVFVIWNIILSVNRSQTRFTQLWIFFYQSFNLYTYIYIYDHFNFKTVVSLRPSLWGSHNKLNQLCEKYFMTTVLQQLIFITFNLSPHVSERRFSIYFIYMNTNLLYIFIFVEICVHVEGLDPYRTWQCLCSHCAVVGLMFTTSALHCLKFKRIHLSSVTLTQHALGSVRSQEN